MENVKILHTADLHLDSPLKSIGDNIKASIRRGELTASFANLVAFANQNEFDAVLIAGDLFDGSKISPKVKLAVLDVFRSAEKLMFFLLGGNHDIKAFEDDFLKLLPDNVKVLGQGKSFCLGNQVNIFGYDAIEEVPSTFPIEKFNIVLLHGQTTSGNDGINLRQLKSKNIDYLALGHEHSFSDGRIDERGVYAYSGCLEGRGFDECGDKGFVTLSISGDKQKHEFQKFSTRNCNIVEVDITNANSVVSQFEKIKIAIQRFLKKDMFKIVLTGDTTEGQVVSIVDLTRLLDGEKIFYGKIEDKTKLKINFEKLQKDVSLKGEFFRVVSQLDFDEKDKAQILKYGFNALGGFEVDDVDFE